MDKTMKLEEFNAYNKKLRKNWFITNVVSIYQI
jgi:hypothetical protein